MKINEFKELINDVTVALNACMSKAAMDAVGKMVDGMYSDGKLTGRQFDTISGVYNDLYNNKLEQWKAACEAAQTCKKLKEGDKQMSKKTEKQAVETKPETLKGEVIDTKNEKIINDAIERVSKKIENIGKGYLSIVGDVARLYDLKAWKVTGHKNIYELCADKFGMARGTVANLRSVFDRYGDRETYKLTDECDGMSLREMLAQIASENKAALEDKNGTSEGEGEGEGAGAGKKTKKVETHVNISFDLASDDWTTETVLAEIKKQLDEANVEFVYGATVTFTLTK